MQTNSLVYSVERGVAYLIKQQEGNGSFLSFSSPDPNNFQKTIPFKSTFSTALILQCLTKLPETTLLKKTKIYAASFLLAQKSKNWTWNYWDRDSQEAKAMPYPDDLDDTFCALTALYLFKQSLITGDALGHSIQALTALEEQEGGPYKTWLIDASAAKIWHDVDLGVNANIAYFLHLQSIKLPHLTALFDQAIATETFTTPYYPKPFPVLYFLSRFIKGTSRKDALRKILMKTNSDTALDLALTISALLNLNISLKSITPMIADLVTLQKDDGQWDATAFYTGVNPQKDAIYYAGSSALTTAFCLEALTLYQLKNQQKHGAMQKKEDPQLIKIHKKVLEKVEKRISRMGLQLRTEMYIYLKQVLKSDKEMQVTLLPLMFSKSLAKDHSISPSLITTLGAASLYGWIAYTIYDNFLDQEADIPSLPAANVCLREVTLLFNEVLPRTTGMQSLFEKIMDRLEEVNTWEVNTCRFDTTLGFKEIKIPDYKNYQVLADRSMGHALGCVAILMNIGYTKDSKEVQSLLTFFSHYLIARQINDDAHDWEKDLKMGQINSVGALLLKKSRKDLEKVFWYDVVDTVCDLIVFHTEKARVALSQIKCIENPKLLIALLEKQEQSVVVTKREKKNALSFLSTYSSKTP